jgi:diguanylate cyclase (GGDEF)-like protein
VPVFVNPNFLINLPTLCAVTAFITVISGALMLFAWLQNRSEPALALWGLGYLIGTAGGACLVRGSADVPTWSICAGNALLCCAYGTMWAGARSFEGRRPRLALVVAGAAIWIAACQFPSFYQSNEARVTLACVIFASYSLLCAWEMWHPRDRELISRWPTLALAVIHAGFLLTRIHYVGQYEALSGAPYAQSVGLFVLAFETLFAAFCQAFLRMSMAKERAELAQRRAALTDPLTEIANRRAFFDVGLPLLKRTLADRRAAALLLFDLDRFKEVNDTAGHQAGDEVLRAFARLVADSIQPGDLLARLGGEEFACLLIDAPMAEALRLAERVRGRFEAMRFAALQADTTVSVGVAMAGDTGRDLSSLLATADRALYRAKAEGRNRVAPAPLVLVERSAESTCHGVALGGAAIIPAPMAG